MDTAITIISLTTDPITATAGRTGHAIMVDTTIINPVIIHGGNIGGVTIPGDGISNGGTIPGGAIIGVMPNAAICAGYGAISDVLAITNKRA